MARNSLPSNSLVALTRLAGLMRKFTLDEGFTPTAIPFVGLLRFDGSTELKSGMLKPSACFVVQGGKRTCIGRNIVEYGEGEYIATAIDMPITGQVTKASHARPYFGLSVEFEFEEIAALVHEIGMLESNDSSSGPGAYVGWIDAEVGDALIRLMRLLEKPQDIPFLAVQVRQEILYRLLTSANGSRLCQSVGLDGRGLGRALAWLREHYASRIRVDHLAREAGMSASSFHRKFKTVTTLTPIQYQQRLRLIEARKQLLSGASGASTAAFDVGYESPSQFSREYRRLFGVAPREDARWHAAGKEPKQDQARNGQDVSTILAVTHGKLENV